MSATWRPAPESGPPVRPLMASCQHRSCALRGAAGAAGIVLGFASLGPMLWFHDWEWRALFCTLMAGGLAALLWPCRRPAGDDLMAVADAVREDREVYVPGWVPEAWVEEFLE